MCVMTVMCRNDVLILSQEALSGNVPYHTKQNEAQVIMLIASKRLPTRPEVGQEGSRQFEMVWDCCRECWKQDPKERLTMSAVRKRVEVS